MRCKFFADDNFQVESIDRSGHGSDSYDIYRDESRAIESYTGGQRIIQSKRTS